MFWKVVAYVCVVPYAIMVFRDGRFLYENINQTREESKKRREYERMRRDALGNKPRVNTIVDRICGVHVDNVTPKADTTCDKNRE